MVVGWSVFNVLAWVALIVAVVIVLLFVTLAKTSADTAAGVVGGVGSGLGALLIGSILACGVYRLEMRPDEPAFLHLRIGADEMRNMALTGLGTAVLLVAGALVAVILGAVRGVPGLGGVLGLAVFAVAVWLVLRILLVAPATFQAGRFAFGAAWQATRGRAWGLLGLVALNACLVALVAITLWIGLLILTGLATGFDGLFASLSNAEAMEQNPGRYLFSLLAQVALWPVFVILTTAPLASAWRQLRPSAEA